MFDWTRRIVGRKEYICNCILEDGELEALFGVTFVLSIRRGNNRGIYRDKNCTITIVSLLLHVDDIGVK